MSLNIRVRNTFAPKTAFKYGSMCVYMRYCMVLFEFNPNQCAPAESVKYIFVYMWEWIDTTYLLKGGPVRYRVHSHINGATGGINRKKKKRNKNRLNTQKICTQIDYLISLWYVVCGKCVHTVPPGETIEPTLLATINIWIKHQTYTYTVFESHTSHPSFNC